MIVVLRKRRTNSSSSSSSSSSSRSLDEEDEVKLKTVGLVILYNTQYRHYIDYTSAVTVR